jgi:hypothetical protein
MGYLGVVLAPSSHCSILIEILGKASWKNELSIAPVATMDSTNSTIRTFPLL